MDAFIDVMFKIYGETGLVGVILLAIVGLLIYPLYTAYKVWVKKRLHRNDLTMDKCLAFDKLDSLINHTIPRLRINCPLRKAIFQDLLTIELRTFHEYLRNIAQKDLNAMNSEEYRTLMSTQLNEAFSVAEKRILEAGIPEVALKKFRDMNNYNEEIIISVMHLISDSERIFESNVEKTMIIANLIGIIANATLVAAEKAIDNLNGQLNDVTFKGKTCEKGCPDCKYAT